jgi:hypothetical protein
MMIPVVSLVAAVLLVLPHVLASLPTIRTRLASLVPHQGREIIAIVPLENGAFCTIFSENFYKF